VRQFKFIELEISYLDKKIIYYQIKKY